MKKYQVLLTRDYIVEVNPVNKDEAKACVEFFVTGGEDASTEKQRERFNFEIVKIKPIRNDAFQIEELKKDE